MSNFVSFYDDYGFVPVRQNISDQEKHFNRRKSLYIQLGLAPALIRGSNILEFGPGSGDNAVFTASLGPESYTLVEGSKVGCSHLQEKIDKGLLGNNVTLVHELIENYKSDRQFDLVLAEGLLPGQDNPEDMLKIIAEHVKPGGALVVTTATYMSLLADIMRRLLLPFFGESDEPDHVQRLCRFFDSHLKQLQFVSRHTEDWVVDSILHPWGENYEFSMQQAASTLSGEFELLGSSPSFNQNWQWYKEFVEVNNNTLVKFSEQYCKQELSFLNRCETVAASDTEAVDTIKVLVKQLYLEHRLFLNDKDKGVWNSIDNKLTKLCFLLKNTNPQTSQVIKDYLSAVDKLWKGASPENTNFNGFPSFWGKGQQYLCMVRS